MPGIKWQSKEPIWCDVRGHASHFFWNSRRESFAGGWGIKGWPSNIIAHVVFSCLPNWVAYASTLGNGGWVLVPEGKYRRSKEANKLLRKGSIGWARSVSWPGVPWWRTYVLGSWGWLEAIFMIWEERLQSRWWLMVSRSLGDEVTCE